MHDISYKSQFTYLYIWNWNILPFRLVWGTLKSNFPIYWFDKSIRKQLDSSDLPWIQARILIAVFQKIRICFLLTQERIHHRIFYYKFFLESFVIFQTWKCWNELAIQKNDIKEDPQFIFFDRLDTLRPIFWGEIGVKKTMVT